MAPDISDDPFANAMSTLRRHLKGCSTCRLAIDVRADYTLCIRGARYALRVAMECESVLKAKRDAAMRRDGAVYACPDLSKHGQAYALSAMPFTVTGAQEELF